jgi:hypothetical protein
MDNFIDGSWALFRRKSSPAGGFFLNLSTRQIQLLKDVQEQTVDYSEEHAVKIIWELSKIGLVSNTKGSLHEISDAGDQLLSLLGIYSSNYKESSNHQEELKRAS